MILIESYLCLSDLLQFNFAGPGFLAMWLGISAVLLTILAGMGRGRLWAIKLLRGSTYAVTALYPVIVAYAIHMRSGTSPFDTPFASIVFISSAIQLPLFFVIYRAFKRVRWLDPKSLPDEWEAPAEPIDPARSGDRPKRGFFGWVLICVIVLAMMIRYYTGILQMDWFGAWLSSNDIGKELAAIAALLVPVLVLALCFMTRHAAFWRRRIGG
ncbi:hypothetical protein [Trinickia acidisoli]|uniref:hypothetical protein n=1 Tax=Trinickia acidisoli TaxID=2767482 RepID=UPI001A8DFA67|nr:hypothetical protein [Trinickia acidisoli]